MLTPAGFTHANLPSWGGFYNEFSGGTGQFRQAGVLSTNANGSWTSDLTVDVDFSQRQVDITSKGQFSGYIDHTGASTSAHGQRLCKISHLMQLAPPAASLDHAFMPRH
jgi:hypothetical protein